MCVFVQVPARMKRELLQSAAATKGNLHISIQSLGRKRHHVSAVSHIQFKQCIFSIKGF